MLFKLLNPRHMLRVLKERLFDAENVRKLNTETHSNILLGLIPAYIPELCINSHSFSFSHSAQ